MESLILGADYISFEEYVKIKGLSVRSMVNRARKGKYKTAKCVDKKWYASRNELDNIYCNFGIPSSEDFITSKEYARINGLGHSNLIYDIQTGKYKTPIIYKATWYIDKKEPCHKNQ